MMALTERLACDAMLQVAAGSLELVARAVARYPAGAFAADRQLLRDACARSDGSVQGELRDRRLARRPGQGFTLRGAGCE